MLTTGASGYLGELLLRKLEADAVPVVGLYRSRRIDDLARRGLLIPADLSDAAEVRRIIRQLRPAATVHCAAATDVRFCENHPSAARKANVEATRCLVDALLEFVPDSPLVHLSTDLVYDGLHPPYREFSPAAPVSIYGTTKLESESAALAHPRGVVLRTALMYGRPATFRSSFLGWMVQTLRDGKPLTLFEDEYRTPIAVDDLIAAILRSLEQGLTGLFVVGGPQRLSRFEMGEIAAEELGLDCRLLVRSRLDQSHYGAPRPPDVSLDSRVFWNRIGQSPRDFRQGIRAIATKTD